MAKNARRAPAGSTRKAPSLPPSTPQKHLDVFANPAAGRDYVIEFVIPEFTCNCPLTGQPDFARFTIEMIADALCVELKSLKLYLWSYRDEGAFHEAVTKAATPAPFGSIRRGRGGRSWPWRKGAAKPGPGGVAMLSSRRSRPRVRWRFLPLNQ